MSHTGRGLGAEGPELEPCALQPTPGSYLHVVQLEQTRRRLGPDDRENPPAKL